MQTLLPLAAPKVAGIGAAGFVLGAAIAIRLGKGFLTIRKGGSLVVDTDQVNRDPVCATQTESIACALSLLVTNPKP